MTVCGIDYSTRFVDFVFLDEDTDAAKWRRFALEGQDGFDRARNVRRAVQLGSEDWESVVAVGIEDPRGYGAGSLYRVQGAILMGIPWNKLVQPWIPSQWRKAVGLAGNAPKDDVRDHACGYLMRHSEAPNGCYCEQWPQDAMDAFCIALATRQLLQVKDAA